ncbi:pyranose 2-oxidase [Punctularia strigosozonata HHB-11173 SS5]|uniref:Pyranose 2-oxidase n=1 Tax=Punctularia strigosozonata (strain HHB-11173) TaxID=741275 RepID=R7RZB9_PUNST|nr:pyranose 2-oxidase [Punctularia strigosozonata HHB-11173 SS5]EIN03465.1 pyranose 2-oxidase [Punctularia strigosozonata HHB-11173 SS5]
MSSKSIEEILREGSAGINPSIKPNKKLRDFQADVFIAGSGPIGATYALLLVEAGYKVVMCELGAADSFKATTTEDGSADAFIPGAHKKNEVEYQKDIDRFVNVIKGALSVVSVPVKNVTSDTLDPTSWGAGGDELPVTNGKNPSQEANLNLAAEAVTRGVGGMTTHWTCATPKFNRQGELPRIVSNEQENFDAWEELYEEAMKLIGTTTHAFDKSIRHTLVLRTLQNAFNGTNGKPKLDFGPLPLACHRMPNPDYVYWHGTDVILEKIYTNPELKSRFRLLTNHRCTRVAVSDHHADGTWTIGAAEVKDFLADVSNHEEQHSYVQAKMYVIAAGAVATPQILFNSGFGRKTTTSMTTSMLPTIHNLGTHITEQPMSFCQIVLKTSLLKTIPNNPYNLSWWKEKVDYQKAKHPEDPLKFPFRDGEPQVTKLFTKDKPWHAQIHRDAFSYGAVAETIDTRTIVDFRFFGYVKPEATNRIDFETKYEDGYGMPQPTFTFRMSDDDKTRAHDMMTDMCNVAKELGGWLPGSEPQFMAPGLALHLGGTVRAGLDSKEHVADTNCKVYNFSNLYVGGNGVIPTGYAANPTLTSMGYAIRSARSIINALESAK